MHSFLGVTRNSSGIPEAAVGEATIEARRFENLHAPLSPTRSVAGWHLAPSSLLNKHKNLVQPGFRNSNVIGIDRADVFILRLGARV